MGWGGSVCVWYSGHTLRATVSPSSGTHSVPTHNSGSQSTTGRTPRPVTSCITQHVQRYTRIIIHTEVSASHRKVEQSDKFQFSDKHCVKKISFDIVINAIIVRMIYATLFFGGRSSVLLKFIQVCPDLRETLWTLDEDGEVSGTVMLMLGSLMMRGALYPPPPPPCTAPQATPATTAGQQQATLQWLK